VSPRAVPLSIRTRLTLWYTAILLSILAVISGLSYSLLRSRLIQDLDTSLLAVGQVVRDTGWAGSGVTLGAGPESTLREILGPEFYDKFFQLVDPEGRPRERSTHLRAETPPLSADARRNAAKGERTLETVGLATGERVRLLTLPITRDGRLVQLVQVGIPLERAQRTLDRYVETLLVLIPLGLILAAAGGAAIARTALRPVDAMSRTARRISGEDLHARLVPRGTGDELDRLGETLNAMLARLEETFAQMRRFTADAAHELRTPLTALKGTIEVALRAERSGEEYRRVLASSLEDVERLVRLAEDLLLLSRLSVPAVAPREPVELEPLLAEVADVARRVADARGVALVVKERAPAAVVGDPIALRRAVMKLVENAVRYTPRGGRAELALRVADRWAEVAVRDTGIGLHPADLERIFEPFVRLDAARARDTAGAGLGLPIARSIVTAHGGTLAAESAPGAGSTFTIRLPLA
jgi:two-component system OmpR family sensor kinase